MEYQLEWCSWEITRKCNINCSICLCGDKADTTGELTTQEALKLCGELAEMRVKTVVLTGGEPLLRKDWSIIAKTLSDYGVKPVLSTNGTLIDERTAKLIAESGIKRVTVSIDGSEKIHDEIRGKGSFSKAREGIAFLRQYTSIPVYAATTVTKDNIGDIEPTKNALIDMGVENWIIHLGLPFGNFKSSNRSVVTIDDIKSLVDQCYKITKEDGRLKILLGDNIGYYTEKELLIRSQALETNRIPLYTGCPCGVSTMAISHDGNILTVSMCVDNFIAGNIRNQTVREIWADDSNEAWAWRRSFKKENLKGACRTCQYVDVCKGGCPAVRYSLTGDIMGENPLCMYSTR